MSDTSNLPPVGAPVRYIEEWLSSRNINASWLTPYLSYTYILTATETTPDIPGPRESAENGFGDEWFGGPAAAPLSKWPRNVNGKPLAHILTLSLDNLDAVLDDESRSHWGTIEEGLPKYGYLEVFHDLETYGNPEDAESAGWLVRWLPEPDHFNVVEPPDDLETPSDACASFYGSPSYMIPSPLDIDDEGSENRFEKTEEVQDAFRSAWAGSREVGDPGEPNPVSHVYGYSQAGFKIAESEYLHEVLPLKDAKDQWRLILDIESWTVLDGWFGDASPLEVWMRQSDLDSRNFRAAWCIVRTD